jgi:NAD(P)-dependent dehydrogenase (short-subunit alcohol dehydrogenase family)
MLAMSNIVITGASRGIGLATALELARMGHQVVATMRNPAGSPELDEHRLIYCWKRSPLIERLLKMNLAKCLA